MSYTAFLSLLMATFVCIGFVLALVMGRLGHSPFAWGVLGLVLGPIALLLALAAARNEPSPARLVASGVPGGGPVDVLVGIDGSRESAAATTAALGLLGGRVGRLTLVAVTEIDDSVAGRQEQVRLREELERQAEAVRVWLREHHLPVQAERPVIPELVLRSGQPAAILDRIAAEDGYGLLVVGARGAGLSSVLLGSVATRLAARASVPVLVIGDRAKKGRGERRLRAVDRADRVADDQPVDAIERLRAGDGPRGHDAGEREGNVGPADRFRLDRVSAGAGRRPKACPAPRSSGPGLRRPRRWRTRWQPTRPPA